MNEKKIKELTKKQRDLIPEYVEKWIKIGTNTDRLDYDQTSEIVADFRNLIGLKSDVPLVIVKNPIEAWVACCLSDIVPVNNLIEEMREVFHGNPKNYDIPDAELPYQSGSFFAPVFSFYDYFYNCVGLKIDEKLMDKYKVWESTSKIGCIYPLDNITVVSEKPIEIHLNENNLVHRDGGPAIVYDGEGDFKCFVLNSVDVPEYLATTPAHELDINDYNKEQNADVKAEFVRKVGIEKFVEKGDLLDTYENYDQEENPWWWNSEYQLYDMKFLFPNLDSAPYLKMLNPTTKIWHLEGVSPNCDTIKKALRERFGGKDLKIVHSS